jgi:ATP-dependent Lon protease
MPEATPEPPRRKPAASSRRPYPVLTLRETLIFPLTTFPLAVGREASLRAVEEASRGARQLVLLSQKQSETEEPEAADLHTSGTLARVRHVVRSTDGSQQVWVQGLERVRVVEFMDAEPYLLARVQRIPERQEAPTPEVEALARNALESFARLVAVSPFLPDELVNRAMNQDSPWGLVYLIASSLRLNVQERLEVLDTNGLRAKYERVQTLLDREIELLELGHKLRGQVQERVEKGQREFFLREQLKAIHKELGDEDPQLAEANELREKVAAASLSDEARTEADRELRRLERLPTASPEHSVIRTYLDWLVSLPWGRHSGVGIDVGRARQVLDEDHYGLDKIKERILEYLAVKKLREERGVADRTREPILCLVGPPGVGKTSLGQSIARATERKFVRLSLGGVHDEAEIRGHRRTYVGAMPGRIVQAFRRADSMDPVFMLDEIDKVGADWRGDPSSALLEVLDPEQNRDFRDHYLDVSLDLGQVMFITTANTVDSIQPALRDRMEVIQLPGYSEDEKVGIATRFLVRKQLLAHGLTEDELTLDEGAIHVVIQEHTREAGVRNLERELATVIRKAAREIAEAGSTPVAMTAERVRDYLGRPKFYPEVAERIDRPGVATGLVWTPAGGDIVFVEASVVPGKKELRITGQLGDVMRESVEAALSHIRTRSMQLGIVESFFETHDIHVHVPGGAVPKDGPSAGVTIAVALASALTGRLVRDDVAMTGEITLRGKVLPVGGVKEKVLGAHRAGLRTVLVPRRNEADLEELPEQVRREMTFVPLDSLDEALELVLTKPSAISDQLSAGLSMRPILSTRTPAEPAAVRSADG